LAIFISKKELDGAGIIGDIQVLAPIERPALRLSDEEGERENNGSGHAGGNGYPIRWRLGRIPDPDVPVAGHPKSGMVGEEGSNMPVRSHAKQPDVDAGNPLGVFGFGAREPGGNGLDLTGENQSGVQQWLEKGFVQEAEIAVGMIRGDQAFVEEDEADFLPDSYSQGREKSEQRLVKCRQGSPAGESNDDGIAVFQRFQIL
jgi:hypothetical protein